MPRVAVVMLGLALLAAPCRAGGNAPPHRFSLTVSPLHFLSPMLQLTGEIRLARKLGVAAIAGGGAVSEDGVYYGAGEIGGQFRFYPVGTFAHGMLLGVEISYLGVDGRLEAPMACYAGGRAGAFVGYKFSMRVGFTLEAEVGPQYVYADADNQELQTLLGQKIGWSFWRDRTAAPGTPATGDRQ